MRAARHGTVTARPLAQPATSSLWTSDPRLHAFDQEVGACGVVHGKRLAQRGAARLPAVPREDDDVAVPAAPRGVVAGRARAVDTTQAAWARR